MSSNWERLETLYDASNGEIRLEVSLDRQVFDEGNVGRPYASVTIHNRDRFIRLQVNAFSSVMTELNKPEFIEAIGSMFDHLDTEMKKYDENAEKIRNERIKEHEKNFLLATMKGKNSKAGTGLSNCSAKDKAKWKKLGIDVDSE